MIDPSLINLLVLVVGAGAIVGVSALMGVYFTRAFYRARNVRRLHMFQTEIARLRRETANANRQAVAMRLERDRMKREIRRQSA